jgi:hypothetical protein
VKFSVCPSTLLNNKECSPLGVNEGVNFTPRGQISPLGAKFTPRGEIHPWGPGVKLRIALRLFTLSSFDKKCFDPRTPLREMKNLRHFAES